MPYLTPRSLMTLLTLAALPLTACASDTLSDEHSHGPKSDHSHAESFAIEGLKTVGSNSCFTSNGEPNHEMGQFPNRANPNAFREQNLTFCFPTQPVMAAQPTYGLMTVGVSVTGVPIRPYTAGYYDPNGRRNIGRTPSDWRQQAMHNPRSLGMDTQNAHIDRSGLYHYHGVSSGLLAAQSSTHIGYAPDGFEIHYAPDFMRSSWQLKSGTRPTPPKGPFDGSYEEDFEYVAGAGTLDDCNGAVQDGAYRYYATDSYPYFPRCFKGVLNQSFMMRDGRAVGDHQRRAGQNADRPRRRQGDRQGRQSRD